MFTKSRGFMGLWGGNPLASSGSTICSSLIGSSPVRSTTRLDSTTLALLAFGATVGFAALLFPTSVVVARGGELNKTLGMGAKREVALGDGLDWVPRILKKLGME